MGDISKHMAQYQNQIWRVTIVQVFVDLENNTLNFQGFLLQPNLNEPELQVDCLTFNKPIVLFDPKCYIYQ